jgi:hypothetical protein
MSKCILPPLYIHILATYTPVYCMSTTVQQRNATQNKLAKHFSNLNNLSLRQNSLFSTPQYLQGSKDSLKGLQMSTIVLERHRSGGHFCLFLYRSHLCYLGFYPTRTVSCEMDYLDRCRSISTHLSHCNLEFFDYSVVKVRENKNPDLCSSILVIYTSSWQTRPSACRKAASHAVLECLNTNQDLCAKRNLRYNCLQAGQANTLYHKIAIMDTAISNLILINKYCNLMYTNSEPAYKE